MAFPQHSEAGIWNLAYVRVYDARGLVRYYETAGLSTMGFPTRLLNTSRRVPELVPVRGGGSIAGKAGERKSCELRADVQNIGSYPAVDVEVIFESSADDGLTFTRLGGAVRVGNLAPSASGTAAAKFFLPPGQYVIRATVDTAGRNAEYSKNNNILTFPLTVK